MSLLNRHFIHVQLHNIPARCQELFRVLQDSFLLKFTDGAHDTVSCSGRIVSEGNAKETKANESMTVASLTVPDSPGQCIPMEFAVQFANDADVPFPFRGRSVVSKAADFGNYLQYGSHEKVLASSDQGVLWVVSAGNGPKRYRSAFPLPAFPPDRIFQEVFNGERFIEVLPLLHFLHEVCGNNTLEGPPLRACFIFDDPNLHWPRYGFVDYGQVVARAEAENYHVSFATIPLDAWYTHGPTAELFRKNPKRFSLCVHGNNHTREELAQNYSPAERGALLSQAVERIDCLERKTGLRVCRVMVPPHGACLEEMLEELPRHGFEAACISHGSLRAYNKSKPWTRRLGCAPSEWIAGCPVMPRWAFSGNIKNTILLAAFLGQPLILRGHHQDLKHGVELLDDIARFINSLGNVSWMNLTDIARTNYLGRMQGQAFWLRPFGIKVNARISSGATHLVIENCSDRAGEKMRILEDGKELFNDLPEAVVKLPLGKSDAIMMEWIIEKRPSGNSARGMNVRAFIRRLLTEGRDRFLVFR